MSDDDDSLFLSSSKSAQFDSLAANSNSVDWLKAAQSLISSAVDDDDDGGEFTAACIILVFIIITLFRLVWKFKHKIRHSSRFENE